ncbi:flavin reductase family protein [Bacillus sp. 31A1R]|uniref:Flavin reductase family protein n=1 Tax=Robertmurraya mangrovi TaxID=3098077 RepID=A0ABU5J3Q3_9BACI|nr:flavin reductase family protein [Bacillus sp. 31A1R]MDZ5473995.1 flavin reductase family protein [Bacillus sp. 31A1R]
MLQRVNQTVMHSYPGMVALVTVNHQNEKNIMAAGWHTYISYEPPIYGVAIGRERYTFELLKAEGAFAINFLSLEYAGFIQQAGVFSGKDVDKFDIGNMDYVEGVETGAPILKNAYVAYECKTLDRNTYGDHDFFVGEIVQFYRDEEKFLTNGLPNFKELSIPLYIGRSTYSAVTVDSPFIEHRMSEK